MLYTGYGDAGTTTLLGTTRLAKCNPRLDVLGALDEAQAHLGLARAYLAATPWAAALLRVQHALGDVMTCIALPADTTSFPEAAIADLEADMACWTSGERGFVTPGATVAGAHLHIARTVVRRAERCLVALRDSGASVSPTLLTYCNRLSSWVFALAVRVDTQSLNEAAA